MTCTNPAHDHAEYDDETGATDENEPMLCRDCRRPTHYDSTIEAYVHDDPEASPCFLIQSRPEGATPCTTETGVTMTASTDITPIALRTQPSGKVAEWGLPGVEETFKTKGAALEFLASQESVEVTRAPSGRTDAEVVEAMARQAEPEINGADVAAQRRAAAYAEARENEAAEEAPKPKRTRKASGDGSRRRTFRSEAGIENDALTENGPSWKAMAAILKPLQKKAEGKRGEDPAVVARDAAIAKAREDGWSFNDLSDAIGKDDNGTFPFRRLAAHNARKEG
jgi:hypothetical protein